MSTSVVSLAFRQQFGKNGFRLLQFISLTVVKLYSISFGWRFVLQEEDLIREQAQRIFGLPIWLSLSTKRLEVEIKKVPNLKKLWDKLLKKEQQKDEAAKNAENFYRFFMRNLMEKFQSVLHAVQKDGNISVTVKYNCILIS